MKRLKSFHSLTILHVRFSFLAIFLTLATSQLHAAIVPPPWSDPERNPCAVLPGGWQLLYWPPLMQCFKIFTMGYPCPDSMELSPTAYSQRMANVGRDAPPAVCRCPPRTAFSVLTNKCHALYERGPCSKGQFFRPAWENQQQQLSRSIHHWGSCDYPSACPDDMIYWPVDGKCYTKHTKGPCTNGKLLVLNADGLTECGCHGFSELRPFYYDLEETCHEHFTRGPCTTRGHLFLPDGRCGCHENLPHYHSEQQMCFELNSPGPCPPGHIFNIPEIVSSQGRDQRTPGHPMRARCQCKEGYVAWPDGNCYRLYTRGPCRQNEFLINSTTCMENHCGRNRLYFPDENSCYRIGSQGPCTLDKVVVYDFTARPSIDGISYNGMCGCLGINREYNQCSNFDRDPDANTCESSPGMVELNGICYKLYSRGPCGPGQWLEPLKTSPEPKKHTAHRAKCVCRPGYTIATDAEGNGESAKTLRSCNAPSVRLARYLTTQNQNHRLSNNSINTSLEQRVNVPNFSLLKS